MLVMLRFLMITMFGLVCNAVLNANYDRFCEEYKLIKQIITIAYYTIYNDIQIIICQLNDQNQIITHYN
jgi:hypothetical protein